MIRFSIIMASFNPPLENVRRTLESVLAQSYDPEGIEMVVVDGGSTNGTVELLGEYQERFGTRLRWISESDRGIYDAFNKGIALSSHEVINFQGAGDWLEPTAVATVSQVFASSSASVVRALNQNWLLNGSTGQLQKDELINSSICSLWQELAIYHQATFYCKQLHDRYGYYDTQFRVVSDTLFFLRVQGEGRELWQHLHYCTSHFVRDGISSQNELLVAIELQEALQYLLTDPDAQLQPLYRQQLHQRYCAFFLQWSLGWQGYKFRWKQASNSERRHLAQHYQHFIHTNRLTEEWLQQAQELRFYAAKDSFPLNIVPPPAFLTTVLTTDQTHLMSVFNRYFRQLYWRYRRAQCLHLVMPPILRRFIRY